MALRVTQLPSLRLFDAHQQRHMATHGISGGPSGSIAIKRFYKLVSVSEELPGQVRAAAAAAASTPPPTPTQLRRHRPARPLATRISLRPRRGATRSYSTPGRCARQPSCRSCCPPGRPRWPSRLSGSARCGRALLPAPELAPGQPAGEPSTHLAAHPGSTLPRLLPPPPGRRSASSPTRCH
jgi:hypothetical protein